MKKEKALWLGAGVVVLSGFGAFTLLRGQHAAQYRTVGADRGDIESTISATGNLNAVVTVEVGTQVSGNIKELYANFNTKVEKGQLVARIDPEIFQARVNQAQANLDAARAAVVNAQANLQKTEAEIANAKAMLAQAKAGIAKAKASAFDAQTKFNRSTELFNNKLIATQDRDSAQAADDAAVAELDAAQALEQAAIENIRSAEAQRQVALTQVSSAEAQVKQQDAALRQAQIDLEHTFIRAPVDGIVVSRKVDVGQTVAASLQAPTLFEIAQDLTKMQVDTNVDEADVGRVRVGQEGVFTVDAYPGRTFHGGVVEIRQAPINVQNVITYDVVVAVSNPDLKLFPGMTANVKVLVDRRDNALRIPNAALRFRPLDAKDQPRAAAQRAFGQGGPGGPRASRNVGSQTIWIVGENGKPAPVSVKLGISDGTYSEVAGGNLTEGQEVIVGLASTQAASAGQPFGGPRGPRF
jgi:HlyD family secretion protein